MYTKAWQFRLAGVAGVVSLALLVMGCPKRKSTPVGGTLPGGGVAAVTTVSTVGGTASGPNDVMDTIQDSAPFGPDSVPGQDCEWTYRIIFVDEPVENIRAGNQVGSGISGDCDVGRGVIPYVGATITMWRSEYPPGAQSYRIYWLCNGTRIGSSTGPIPSP